MTTAMSDETVELAERLLVAHVAVDGDVMCLGCATEDPPRLVAVGHCVARAYANGVMKALSIHAERLAGGANAPAS